MRMGWRKFLWAGVVCGLGLVQSCTVEVVEGPASGGSGGNGGSAGTGGTGGVTADAAPRDAVGSDAPSSDAPSADGAGADMTADAPAADTALDATTADSSTGLDASPDRGDGGTADRSESDAPVADASIADGPVDAGGGCFADDPLDGGTANDCTSLPYYDVVCRDDAGIDFPPAGATLCTTLNTDLKVSAFQELLTCLKSLPGEDGGMDACSSAHEQGSADCSRSIFNRSMCPVPDSAADGGLYGCEQIAASCGPDSGDGGIPVALCQAWLGPFNAASRQGIIDCYLGPDPVGATSCRDKFENYCVFN